MHSFLICKDMHNGHNASMHYIHKTWIRVNKMPSHKQTQAQAHKQTHTHMHTLMHTHTHSHMIWKAKGGSEPQLAQCDKCVFTSRKHTKLSHKHMQQEKQKERKTERLLFTTQGQERLWMRWGKHDRRYFWVLDFLCVYITRMNLPPNWHVVFLSCSHVNNDWFLSLPLSLLFSPDWQHDRHKDLKLLISKFFVTTMHRMPAYTLKHWPIQMNPKITRKGTQRLQTSAKPNSSSSIIHKYAGATPI